MSLGQRINDGLARLLIVDAHGATVDFGKDSISTGKGGHGTHKERGRRPSGSSRPLVEQWAERAQRVAEGIEEDIRAIQCSTEARSFTTTKADAERLRRVIRDYEGRDPVYVAYHESCSVELVRKVRREKDLDIKTGAPLERRERPLTAPPSHTLSTLTQEEA